MCADSRQGHAGPAAFVLVVFLGLGASACGASSPDRPRATPTPRGGSGAPAQQPSGEPSARRVAWTHDAVLRRLDGRRIRVRDRSVPIDSGTLACGGLGRPTTRRDGEPAWTRFRCVQPTFPPDAVAGPDAIFVIEPTGRRTFVVTDRRFTSY